MKMVRATFSRLAFLFLVVPSLSFPVYAHQPVMDMAPRWEDGWGFQLRHEYRWSDDVMKGDSDISNRSGRKRRIQKTWLEGVYTFKRELRLTFKVPWVEQSRTVVKGIVPVNQRGSGFGDTILGLQLKRYYNKETSTGNFGLTPSVRFPTGSTSDSFPVGDGSWDAGLSASFSAEAANLFQFYDLFYWKNGNGRKGIREGDELGFDMNLGIHPYHNNLKDTGIFVMMDLEARAQDRGRNGAGVTGGKRLSIGPVLVWYRDNVMIRSEVKFPVYEKVRGTQVSHGTQWNFGIGVTF